MGKTVFILIHGSCKHGCNHDWTIKWRFKVNWIELESIAPRVLYHSVYYDQPKLEPHRNEHRIEHLVYFYVETTTATKCNSHAVEFVMLQFQRRPYSTFLVHHIITYSHRKKWLCFYLYVLFCVFLSLMLFIFSSLYIFD